MRAFHHICILTSSRARRQPPSRQALSVCILQKGVCLQFCVGCSRHGQTQSWSSQVGSRSSQRKYATTMLMLHTPQSLSLYLVAMERTAATPLSIGPPPEGAPLAFHGGQSRAGQATASSRRGRASEPIIVAPHGPCPRPHHPQQPCWHRPRKPCTTPSTRTPSEERGACTRFPLGKCPVNIKGSDATARTSTKKRGRTVSASCPAHSQRLTRCR